MADTKPVATPIEVSPVINVPSNKQQGRRQSRARAQALFSQTKIEYLGSFPLVGAQAIEQGKTVKMLGLEFSKSNDTAAKCRLCDLTHRTDLPERFALTKFYRDLKHKVIFALSESCRKNHVDSQAAVVLSNPDVYRVDWPLPIKTARSRA